MSLIIVPEYEYHPSQHQLHPEVRVLISRVDIRPVSGRREHGLVNDSQKEIRTHNFSDNQSHARQYNSPSYTFSFGIFSRKFRLKNKNAHARASFKNKLEAWDLH